MTDIVERLHKADPFDLPGSVEELCQEAAREIERLRAELDGLKPKALTKAAKEDIERAHERGRQEVLHQMITIEQQRLRKERDKHRPVVVIGNFICGG